MIFEILKTIAITSLISGILALLLVIAEKIFANYGECEININDKKKLKVEGGSSLLSTLNEAKIYLPSACGGRGSCGFCKCKVESGGGPLLPTEKPYLTESEIKNNVRLSCQVKVKEDIKIQIPEEIFNIKKFKAKIVEIKELTYDIKQIRFKLLEPNMITFKAGQYVQLHTKAYKKSKKVISRAYSISSNPNHDDFIELIIRKVPDGICTTWVHDYLQENEEVEFTGPFGDFYIRETGKDMIFIAGGSGKAPIKSMLEFLSDEKSSRRMAYYFGAQGEKDLYYTDYINKFKDNFENFNYIPVLSRCENKHDWNGLTGYIPPHIHKFIKDPKNTEAYLCGSPGLLNATVKKLKELNVPEDQIFFDSF